MRHFITPRRIFMSGYDLYSYSSESPSSLKARTPLGRLYSQFNFFSAALLQPFWFSVSLHKRKAFPVAILFNLFPIQMLDNEGRLAFPHLILINLTCFLRSRLLNWLVTRKKIKTPSIALSSKRQMVVPSLVCRALGGDTRT